MAVTAEAGEVVVSVDDVNDAVRYVTDALQDKVNCLVTDYDPAIGTANKLIERANSGDKAKNVLRDELTLLECTDLSSIPGLLDNIPWRRMEQAVN